MGFGDSLSAGYGLAAGQSFPDDLQKKLDAVPEKLAHLLTLSADGLELTYQYDTRGERTGITSLLDELRAANIRFKDLRTTQSSLEEIFVSLVKS